MSNPIRILHVIGIMDRGGAETMIMNLYRRIDRTKIQFDFVQNENDGAAYDDEIRALGGRIYHCPRYRGKNHFAYTKWWHAFFETHRGEYPIIHGHIGSTAAIYLSVAKKHGIYTIAHSHNINLMRSVGDVIYGVYTYPTRFIADHFFACSREAGVSRYGKKNAGDPGRCTVLRNAIDSARFAFDADARHQVREALNLSEDQIVIGNISRFSAQKNHAFLLDIFERIRGMEPRAVLLLVGDGDLRPQIEEKIRRAGLENSVILTGVQPNTWDYYRVMDVFLMPSHYEGLPVSMVEAQASGLPCCVSSAVPEESAITGLVRFRALDDGAEQWASWVLACAGLPRRDMSEAIRRAGYDISATSQWLEEFYTKVVNSRG